MQSSTLAEKAAAGYNHQTAAWRIQTHELNPEAPGPVKQCEASAPASRNCWQVLLQGVSGLQTSAEAAMMQAAQVVMQPRLASLTTA